MARYAIITPAHNEAYNLPQVIESILKQNILPIEWIILDDRSVDDTWKIVREAAERHAFIKPVKLNGDHHRRVGENVVQVFDQGIQRLSNDVEFLTKMDADIVLVQSYFSTIFEHFSENPRLGMASGKTFVKDHKKWRLERCPDTHVCGPCKTYRYECYKDIQGLIPILGWDILDCAEARMKGWETRSYRDLPLYHLRQMGSAKGMLKGRLRTGRAMHSIRAHPLFVLVKSFYRSIEKPYLSGLLILAGFLMGFMKKSRRLENDALVRFLRKEQISRVLGHGFAQEEILPRKLKKE